METINFEETFVSTYPNREFLLRYMHEALGKDEIEWSDLTAFNLRRIAEYIKTKVTANSANSYFAKLKAFLNLMADDVELPTNKFASILKTKREPQQNVALTEDEVERIYQYYKHIPKDIPLRKREREVLTLFLIECYCGGRGIDVENMTTANIENGRLSYVSKKTHTLATMPVHCRLRELLLRKPKNEYSRMTKNRIVKTACKRCGIDEKVTIYYHGSMQTKPKYEFCAFHTARRSFASILAAKGVPILEISQYMSHSNISMTERYIKVDRNYVSDAAQRFFNCI